MKPTPEPNTPLALGVMEITISGIGTPGMSANAVAIASGVQAPEGPSYALTPVEHPWGTNGIQLEPLSTGSFTYGERGNGGVRHVYATFRVRNANLEGSSYNTQRNNLTFLAAITDKTLGETAISHLVRFDGAQLGALEATTVLPTGAVAVSEQGEVVSPHPDVLQVFAEAELAEVQAKVSTGVELLPYGFVVRRAGQESTRTLPATPGWSQFDGLVTFAFKVPLQATPAEDPFMISFMALAVDDGETRITQSLEEQDVPAGRAFARRAAELGARAVTLLPGGRYDGSAAARVVCTVRTAGQAAAPTATLLPDPGTRPWLLNDVHALLPISTDFTAARCGEAWNAPDASNFVVNGSQSGRMFLGQSYSRDGVFVRTPAGKFFPGEEVEVVLTTTFGQPVVARYRVRGAPALARFQANQRYSVGLSPRSVATGDLNGDGNLDIVVSVGGRDEVGVLLGDGAGGFSVAKITVDPYPRSVALGDVNGDGNLDLILAFENLSTLGVLLGDGAGGFSPAVHHQVGSRPSSVALGDLNGDGNLDIAATYGGTRLAVLLGDGIGNFSPHTGLIAAGTNPAYVVLGDVNGDGKLDMVAANPMGNSVSVMLANATGGFAWATQYAVGTYPESVALGDVNGDGKLDLVTANAESHDLSVLLGDGTGSFAPHRRYTTEPNSRPRSIAFNDMNGDGKLDIVVTNERSNSVSVLFGNGAGDFALAGTYGVGYGPVSLAVGDVDNDGTLDVIMADMGSASVTVRRNTP